jgi:hypothetical protein
LSESSPTAREDAIEQMLQQQPNRREQIFYSGKEAAIISGLPTHWLLQNQERQRLGIPFYSIADGSLIRFSIEEIFRWEVHHLRPCRSDADTVADAPQPSASS